MLQPFSDCRLLIFQWQLFFRYPTKTGALAVRLACVHPRVRVYRMRACKWKPFACWVNLVQVAPSDGRRSEVLNRCGIVHVWQRFYVNWLQTLTSQLRWVVVMGNLELMRACAPRTTAPRSICSSPVWSSVSVREANPGVPASLLASPCSPGSNLDHT